MTSIEHNKYGPKHYVLRTLAVQIFSWWVERRNYRKFRQEIAHLTDRQLRDIGLERHALSKRDLILHTSRFTPQIR